MQKRKQGNNKDKIQNDSFSRRWWGGRGVGLQETDYLVMCRLLSDPTFVWCGGFMNAFTLLKIIPVSK